jgi:hypothetical protein
MNTERETELLTWIMFLFDVLNRYSVFFGLISRDVKWIEDMWEDENIKGKQDELVEILQEKYGLSMRVMSNVEAIEGNENGQSNSV